MLLQGVLTAFKGELIHIYNKREGALLNTGHFQELRTRPNVLLVGDSLGDLNMADGVQDMENILKIGFLNDKVRLDKRSKATERVCSFDLVFHCLVFASQVEKRIQSYLDAYDVVLVEDETMEVPNAILLYLTGNK